VEPESLLSWSRDPATGSYPETVESSSHPHRHCFFKIYFNIVLPSTPRSLKLSLLFRFSNQSVICFSHLPYACCMSHPSNPPSFQHVNYISWKVKIMKLPIVQFSYLLSLNFLLSTLFSSTLNLWDRPCGERSSLYNLYACGSTVFQENLGYTQSCWRYKFVFA
jgi:hypothetical protein